MYFNIIFIFIFTYDLKFYIQNENKYQSTITIHMICIYYVNKTYNNNLYIKSNKILVHIYSIHTIITIYNHKYKYNVKIICVTKLQNYYVCIVINIIMDLIHVLCIVHLI